MDEKFEPSILTNLLGIYYQRLFPYDSYYRWLSYGNVSKNCFSHREFSFTLADDIYMRYRSFSSQSELEVDLQKYLPHKIDIGAVYNYRPKDRRSISTFQPLERELVFDIDITDYDDVRNCCDGAKICKKCWPLMTIAIKILDRALTEDFGFQDLLWVYSGRRGVHCWVCDEKARKLSASARSAIAEYLSAVKGGAFQSKKVNLGEADLHASFQKAVEIIGEHFTSLQLENQGIMDNQLNYRKILRWCENDNLRKTIDKEIATIASPKDRWEHVKQSIHSMLFQAKKVKNLVSEIEMQLCYPRLDINVTKGLNHLLKSPFCIHPKTGRVCIPIDPKNADKFDPFTVPTISQLCREIDEFDANQKENLDKEGHKKIKDYKKTSLAPSIQYFEAFVSKIEKSNRSEKSKQNGEPMEF